MKKSTIIIYILLMLLGSSYQIALASSLECTRPVTKVWAGKLGNLYIEYGDGYAPATISREHTAKNNIDSILQIILAGFIEGRTLTFNYKGGLDSSPPSCQPLVIQEIDAVAINKQ